MKSKQSDVIEISLADLGRVLVRRLGFILLAAVAVAAIMFAVVKITFVPQYSSVATVYILKQDGESTTNTDFSLALNVVNDCTFILKSHAVLDKVISEQKLAISYEKLADSISTSNPSSTRVLQVTVKADTPEEAKRIVDAVCEEGVIAIEKAMGYSQANLYEYGVLNTRPCNTVPLKYYAVAAFAAALVTYIGFAVAFMMDDSLKTADDISEKLGLTVLAEIPNMDSRSGGYGKYGYGYGYGQKKGAKSSKGGSGK